MRVALASIAACALVLGASVGHAEQSANELLKNYDASPIRREIIEFAVQEIENGLSWANTFLENQKQQPIYCSPPKIALTGSQTLDIFRRYLTDHPNFGSYDFSLIVLMSLRDAFPCESNSK